MKKTFILLLMFFVLGTMFSTEIYVRFKSNTTLPQAQKGKKKVDAKLLPLPSKIMDKYKVASKVHLMSFVHNDILQRTFKMSVPEDVDVNAFIQELLSRENVEMVEIVPEDMTLMVPDDEFYDTIMGYNLKWHLDLINAERAWDSIKGNPDVIVAVVDNAIYGDHEDLQIPPSMQYNIVGDSVGRSYPLGISPTSTEARLLSHGTHCAGSIGAINNNGTGIASLSSGVTLMACGGWSLDNPKSVIGGYEGIIWAAEHGARIISCSWGTKSSTNTNREIIRECYENGILVVGGAGNDGQSTRFYPGAYEGAMSVASVDGNHRLSSFSNRGEWVTIAAPGGFGDYISVFSTYFCYSGMADLTGGESSPFYQRYYDHLSGTSMACPIAAALAGLMLSKNQSLTPDEIIAIMQATAQDKNSLNISPNSGIIDAAKAIDSVAVPEVLAVEDRNDFHSGLSVYPNPVSDYINLSGLASETVIVEVFDLNGRKVISDVLRGMRINVSSLKSGFYIARVMTDNGVETIKFVKE